MVAKAQADPSPPVEVVGLLAEGGMSEIYLGRHPGDEDLIVLKRLPPESAKDPALLRMFRDEARISRLVCEHPNIVRYLEHGALDGSEFIAFELVEGLNVAEILQRTASREVDVPAPVALRIAIGVLDALAHAHAATDDDGEPMTLVHRDVSPTNIVVTWDGVVKLLDFGVSKSEGRTLDTAPGLVKGKPYFMAPEQLRTETIDHRVDLYALGVVLYFLLTKRHPFEGHEDTNIFEAMLEGKVTPPDEIVPDLPEPLCQAILRALRVEPDERFDSAEQMKAALLDTGIEVASLEDVMMFLSDVAEPDAGRRGAKVPKGIGGASWAGVDPEDEAAHAALDEMSKPYRAQPEDTPNSGDLLPPFPEQPAVSPAISSDLPSLPPPPLPPAPEPPPQPPAVVMSSAIRAVSAPAPSPGQRAVWGLTWLVLGIVIATWMLRLLAMTPRPALILDSTPPGAIVYVDDVEQPGRTPVVLLEWPGPSAGAVQVRWTRPGYEPCTLDLDPEAGRTVHGHCRLRRQK